MNIGNIYNGARYGRGNYTPDTEIDITKFASVVQTAPAPSVSNRYAFIPTTQPITVLKDHGWFPVAVTEPRHRVATTPGYGKHVVRFVNEKYNREMEVGAEIPQLIMLNDHSGGGAFEFFVGLFRKICANQLCVSSGDLSRIKVRHVGYADQLVETAVQEIMERTPRTLEMTQTFKQVTLNRPEQEAFAKAAIEMKFDGDKYAVAPRDILSPRRTEDRPPTLWNTYNVVQENVIKGGVRQERKDGSRIRSRAVNNIREDIRMNRALWVLTEELAKAKGIAVQ